jgi:hypothetical protein
MAQLPRQQAQLATMVCFVSDEVVEKVDEVSGKVLPRGRRDRAATRYAKPDQFDHAFAAAFQCPR